MPSDGFAEKPIEVTSDTAPLSLVGFGLVGASVSTDIPFVQEDHAEVLPALSVHLYL